MIFHYFLMFLYQNLIPNNEFHVYLKIPYKKKDLFRILILFFYHNLFSHPNTFSSNSSNIFEPQVIKGQQVEQTFASEQPQNLTLS